MTVLYYQYCTVLSVLYCTLYFVLYYQFMCTCTCVGVDAVVEKSFEVNTANFTIRAALDVNDVSTEEIVASLRAVTGPASMPDATASLVCITC